MRQLLNTKRGCPIVQLYLELGHTPARFDIVRSRLFFLKYIVDQEEKSLILKFFNLQVKNPSKFDWASTCLTDLKEMDIHLTLSDIKGMSESRYKDLIRRKCREYAFKYLMNKRGSKGSEINVTKIRMAEYLLPNNNLTIKEQRTIFSIRNRMVSDIPANFSSSKENTEKCICGEQETMEHVYNCKYLNTEEPDEDFLKIFNGNPKEQRKVQCRFEQNLANRDEQKEESSHAILLSDPPTSNLYEFGNG